MRRQNLAAESGRNAVDAPEFGFVLVDAGQKPLALLPHVEAAKRVSQCGQLARQGRDQGRAFRHQMLVQKNDERQLQADQRRHLGRPHAGRVDDDLGRQLALVRRDAPFAGGKMLERGDFGVGANLGAVLPRQRGHGVGRARRIGAAAAGREGTAQYVVQFDEGEEGLDLLEADQLHVDA